MEERKGNSASRSVHSREARSDASKERVAAVVVTYNRKELLRQCLEALRAQTHPLVEVIVVDNASTDGTRAMVREAYPEVDLVGLETNRGGAGGFHVGMKCAIGRGVDWVWVMDDDAEPAPDALEQLFAPGLHQRNEIVGLSPLIVDTNGEPQKIHAGWYRPCRMIYEPLAPTDRTNEQIGYSSFVGFLIRRCAAAQVGLPDDGFFIWGDDTEYSLRLKNVGELYLVQDSVIVHHDAFSSDRKQAKIFSKAWRDRPIEQYWRNYYALRNRLLIARNHASNRIHLWKAYAAGVLRLMRSVAAVIVLDDYKFTRLKILFLAFAHGVEGRSGKFVDPAEFPEKWIPE